MSRYPFDMRDRDPLALLVCGTAGQGAVFSASLIANAAAMAGHHVSETARSSAAVRSGPSTAHVLFSAHPIDFPFVQRPDILIALSERAFAPAIPRPSPTGVVFYDSSIISSPPPLPVHRCVPIPAASEAAAAALPDANLVLVGAACRLTGILSFEGLLDVVATFDTGIREPDTKALRLGLALADRIAPEAS